MTEELKACRNCGGKCDPTGWMRGDGRQGPECEGCGITTPDVESWNRLMDDQLPSQGGEAVAYLTLNERGQCQLSVGRISKSSRPLYTHPADQVAEGVVVSRELLERLEHVTRTLTPHLQSHADLCALLAKT